MRRQRNAGAATSTSPAMPGLYARRPVGACGPLCSSIPSRRRLSSPPQCCPGLAPTAAPQSRTNSVTAPPAIAISALLASLGTALPAFADTAPAVPAGAGSRRLQYACPARTWSSRRPAAPARRPPPTLSRLCQDAQCVGWRPLSKAGFWPMDQARRPRPIRPGHPELVTAARGFHAAQTAPVVSPARPRHAAAGLIQAR